MTDSGSALQSLLLFQSVASYGATEDSFVQIAESFKTSDLLRPASSVTTDPFDARTLTETFLRLLKIEAKRAVQDASTDPSQKIESPRLSTVEDAAAHVHLIPQLIAKLYEEYKQIIIREIEEDEKEYDELLQQQQSTSVASDDKTLPNPEIQEPIGGEESITQGTSSKQPAVDPTIDELSPANHTQDSQTLHDSAIDSESRSSEPSVEQPKSASTSLPQTLRPEPSLETSAGTPQTGSRGSSTSHPSSKSNAFSLQPSSSSDKPVDTGKNNELHPSRPISKLSTLSSRQPSQDSAPTLPLPPSDAQPPAIYPSQYSRWMQSPYNSPYRSQTATPAASVSHQGPSIPAHTQPRRPGGVQLPPFSINPPVPPTTQTASREAGPPPLSVKTSSEHPPGPTPTNKLVTALNSTPAAVRAAAPSSLSNVLNQRPDVHFSPGSSTGWRGTITGEKTRPRSVSPISDTESNAKGSVPKSTTRRKKPPGPPPAREAQANGAGRRPSKTPSVAGLSNHNRTRSQSVASVADDASVASLPSTAKGLKTEVSTPTPGERASMRQTRGNVSSTTTVTAKRKRGSSMIETPGTASRGMSPFSTTSRPPPMQPPSTVTATRNFSRMTAPLMDHIASLKHASLFANPVNARTQGYYDIIRWPTDLKTIRSQISAGNRAVVAATLSSAGGAGSPGSNAITPVADSATSMNLVYSEDLVPPKAIVNAAQLEQELMRMFANAVMFNEGDEGVVADTRETFESVEKSIAQWRDAESGWQDASGFDDGVGGAGGSAKRRRA